MFDNLDDEFKDDLDGMSDGKPIALPATKPTDKPSDKLDAEPSDSLSGKLGSKLRHKLNRKASHKLDAKLDENLEDDINDNLDDDFDRDLGRDIVDDFDEDLDGDFDRYIDRDLIDDVDEDLDAKSAWTQMLDTRIPPPIVGFGTAVLILLLNWRYSGFQFHHELLKVVAFLVILIGLVIEFASVALFFKNRTTVNPLKPGKSSVLVVEGFNRYSRNPMYLGMLILLTGLILWVGNLVAAPALVIFVLYITQFQIKPEERALKRIFGKPYIDYQHSVRRWI